MSEQIIQISASLWLAVPVVHPDYDDGLFSIRDDTGGDVLIDREEIPKLIEALQKVAEGRSDVVVVEETQA